MQLCSNSITPFCKVSFEVVPIGVESPRLLQKAKILRSCFFTSYHSVDFVQIMDQLQDDSTSSIVKAKPTLDTIPEDVALQIAKVIQSWAEIGGSREEKERARR